MSSRLAFQTQLASIMEVLANAAVAEICKLVDDDYAVVSLQMSQCQRENKALKRKLHLLELKMARGNAEKRLRESALNSSRLRVQISASDRLREISPSAADGAFDQQLSLWTDRAASVPGQSDCDRSKSPDVQLVEPEPVLVKEETTDANVTKAETKEEDVVHIIEDNGIVECAPHARSKHSLEKRDTPPASSQTKTPPRSRQRTSSRGAEVSDSSPHLKSHLNPSQHKLQTSQQRTNVDSSDLQYDLCNNKSPMMLIDDFLNKTSGVEVQPTKPSCSYSMATTDFPSTSSSMNGPTPYILEYPLASSFTDSSKPWNQPAPKQRLFVCSFCGKAFNRPKKVEIHQRIHTGEKPFHCSTCGKMFSEAGNLKKHQRVHTGEKPYSCQICGATFAWIRNVKMHQQKYHPEGCAGQQT